MNTILMNAAARRIRPRGARRTPYRQQKAFTLRELIVVLVVVSLAAVVLLPAFVEASLTPNALVCQAMLRAIGVANMVYANDNNDCLVPVVAYYQNPNPVGIMKWHYVQLLQEPAGYDPPDSPHDYGDPTDIFHGCPDRNPNDPAWNTGYGVVYILLGDYTQGTFTNSYNAPGNYYNYYNEGETYLTHGFRRRSDFALPAQQGWAGDSCEWHIGGGSGVNYVPNADPVQAEYPNWCNPVTDGWTFGKDPERHGDSANYLFADGHVESLHWSVSGNAFWNTTKLLHPGDFNGDMTVDTADYTVWADHFGPTGWEGHPADPNGDGVVDIADYTVWADHFGETRPTPFGIAQSVAPLTMSEEVAPDADEDAMVAPADEGATAAPQPCSAPRRATRLTRARRQAELRARRNVNVRR